MSRLFGDAVYYIALIHTSDALHGAARGLREAIRQDDLVTIEPVLTEVLDEFCGRGAHARGLALATIDALRADPRHTIIPQTPQLFESGLVLYRGRPDKGYSQTDCMSMAICEQLDIRQVLTHDRHFAQEGFEILL